MTVLLESKKQSNKLFLDDITWEKFVQIESTFQDIKRIKFIYLDEELEIIMSPSRRHEEAKSTIGALLESYMRQKGIRFYIWGSATLGRNNGKKRT